MQVPIKKKEEMEAQSDPGMLATPPLVKSAW